MDKKTADRIIKLLDVMDGARAKQVSNMVKSVRFGNTATGNRHQAIYERQHDVYAKASADLAQLIADARVPDIEVKKHGCTRDDCRGAEERDDQGPGQARLGGQS